MSLAELEQRMVNVAIDELHRGEPGVDEATPSQRCLAEIAIRRLDRVKITQVRRRSREGAFRQTGTGENRFEDEGILKRTGIDHRKIGKDAFEGCSVEGTVLEACAGET